MNGFWRFQFPFQALCRQRYSVCVYSIAFWSDWRVCCLFWLWITYAFHFNWLANLMPNSLQPNDKSSFCPVVRKRRTKHLLPFHPHSLFDFVWNELPLLNFRVVCRIVSGRQRKSVFLLHVFSIYINKYKWKKKK